MTKMSLELNSFINRELETCHVTTEIDSSFSLSLKVKSTKDKPLL